MGLNYDTKDFDDFFSDIMLNDNKMISFLQKFLGYSISGNPNLQKFIIFWSDSSNGKSVLMGLMSTLLSKFYRPLTTDILMETKKSSAGSASPQLLTLVGCRFGCIDESSEDNTIDEKSLKTLCSGSKIKARPLYVNDYVDIDTTFQLFLLTNYK